MDADLRISLIESTPNLVTPIGIATDQQDQVYILESHTHSPTSDYDGPTYDRIKIGKDVDGDAVPDEWHMYADSIEDGMNLTIDDQGTLFLATKDQVFAFTDEDGNGISDQRKLLLEMITPTPVYDHAGILGVTSTADGWIYVTRGNTGGKRWRIKGADGSFIDGFGDGGNVIRCTKEGGAVEEIATGFWNPFAIDISSSGRLLVTDNDPDSRGPNRLVEIVMGGDYGYQSLYGGSGIHPFLAWNGELPGTLPYAAPLGEAPCDIIDASYTNFPDRYRGHVLAAVWEENAIVHIPLKQRGSSIKGIPKKLIQGDSLFHPVAMATNSKGDVFLTDWVIRQYPNHGEGRLWMISGQSSHPMMVHTEAKSAGHALELPSTTDEIKEHLLSADPFLRAKARNTHNQKLILQLVESDQPQLRTQGLLMARDAAVDINKDAIFELLSSPEEEVQVATMLYLSKLGMPSDKAVLEKAFAIGSLSAKAFDAYLATIRHLNPSFIEARSKAKDRRDKALERKLPAGFIQNIVTNPAVDPSIRASALRAWPKRSDNYEILASILNASSASDLLEATIYSLRDSDDPEAAALMLSFAMNPEKDVDLRALTIVALLSKQEKYCSDMIRLLEEDLHILSVATLRYLKRCNPDGPIKEQVNNMLDKVSVDLAHIWHHPNEPKNGEPSQGDPAVGKIVFHLPQAQCRTCHKVDGWGGVLGPDLSHIGSSKGKELLTESILEPSAQIAPEWQGWFVIDQEGNYHVGRQIDVGRKNVELLDISGDFITYKEPKDYGLAEASLMPPGLHLGMTDYEFAGLLAYLAQLK
ncbi:MAG: hypothetical protein HKN87_09265 [Saprospiraceae bacterium]|nr:hypothetical protein [Saprospiraceae bacterium]